MTVFQSLRTWLAGLRESLQFLSLCLPYRGNTITNHFRTIEFNELSLTASLLGRGLRELDY